MRFIWVDFSRKKPYRMRAPEAFTSHSEFYHIYFLQVAKNDGRGRWTRGLHLSQKGVLVSKIVKQFLKEMKPVARPGPKPSVTACPYCGVNMSQSNHAKHRPGCKTEFQNAPPQAAELDQDPGGGYNPDGTFPQT
jgi:hypothetical protein